MQQQESQQEDADGGEGLVGRIRLTAVFLAPVRVQDVIELRGNDFAAVDDAAFSQHQTRCRRYLLTHTGIFAIHHRCVDGQVGLHEGPEVDAGVQIGEGRIEQQRFKRLPFGEDGVHGSHFGIVTDADNHVVEPHHLQGVVGRAFQNTPLIEIGQLLMQPQVGAFGQRGADAFQVIQSLREHRGVFQEPGSDLPPQTVLKMGYNRVGFVDGKVVRRRQTSVTPGLSQLVFVVECILPGEEIPYASNQQNHDDAADDFMLCTEFLGFQCCNSLIVDYNQRAKITFFCDTAK